MQLKLNQILILGAGAIGQVIGTHLRLSGCDVTFWVRESQKPELEKKGLTIFNIKTETELHISAPQLLTQIPAEAKYDAIFICVRSDQLDAALAQIKSSFAHLEDMLIIPMQPGRDDALKTFRALSDAIIVPMTPTFSSFATDTRIEYWAPKQMPNLVGPPFNETLHVRDELVRLLQQGGLPTKGVTDIEAETRIPSAALIVLMTGLYLADDSLSKLFKNKALLNLCAQAIQEAVAIVKKDLGFIPLKYKALETISADALQAFYWSLQRAHLGGFLEKMWKSHAPKVRQQTYLNLEDLLNLSVSQSKKTPVALTALAAMTPAKISEYLKSAKHLKQNDSQKMLQLGLSLGFGALMLWRFIKRRRA